ncbi:hypothetical protein HK096_010398 [Nowakowskiella sp. JEL0078]|nr:hypothetical protein HK096_010398 [Nowakowskiella sp. JEL0078]
MDRPFTGLPSSSQDELFSSTTSGIALTSTRRETIVTTIEASSQRPSSSSSATPTSFKASINEASTQLNQTTVRQTIATLTTLITTSSISVSSTLVSIPNLTLPSTQTTEEDNRFTLLSQIFLIFGLTAIVAALFSTFFFKWKKKPHSRRELTLDNTVKLGSPHLNSEKKIPQTSDMQRGLFGNMNHLNNWTPQVLNTFSNIQVSNTSQNIQDELPTTENTSSNVNVRLDIHRELFGADDSELSQNHTVTQNEPPFNVELVEDSKQNNRKIIHNELFGEVSDGDSRISIISSEYSTSEADSESFPQTSIIGKTLSTILEE